MRVLAVGNKYPPHHLGGYELLWRSASEHLRCAGHSVRVLTSDYHTPEPSGGAPEDPDVHRQLRWYWRDHGFPRLSLGERRSLERSNGAVLDRHLAEFQPDVVAWWAMGGMSLSLIERVRRAGIPAVGFVGDDWLWYGPKVDQWRRAFGRLGPLAGAAECATGIPTRLDLSGAARWIFISETMRERAENGRWNLSDTAVAHPGVDTGMFSVGPARPWGWRLLYAGRIERRKGINIAIRALDALPVEAVLTIDGPGDEEHLAELRSLAADAGLGDRVVFTRSERSALQAAYAAADAVIFPVLWEEPWGLVPLEAMAVGTPVVATGKGGSGEYLRDGENCVLYEPAENPMALATAVARLASDDELRARLRAGGLSTAEHFDEASFGQAVIDALERAATAGRHDGAARTSEPAASG